MLEQVFLYFSLTFFHFKIFWKYKMRISMIFYNQLVTFVQKYIFHLPDYGLKSDINNLFWYVIYELY